MTTKEKLIELLEKMGWKVKESDLGILVIEKEIEPVGGVVTQLELPSNQCIFICFDIKTNILTYLIQEREFEYVLGYLTVLPFENEN